MTPQGWKCIEVADGVSFYAPQDAQEQEAQPVDSIFGVLVGEGYEIAYDYSNTEEDLSIYSDAENFVRSNQEVGGVQAARVSFDDPEAPGKKITALQLPSDRMFLTVRVSCDTRDQKACDIGEEVLTSVRVD